MTRSTFCTVTQFYSLLQSLNQIFFQHVSQGLSSFLKWSSTEAHARVAADLEEAERRAMAWMQEAEQRSLPIVLNGCTTPRAKYRQSQRHEDRFLGSLSHETRMRKFIV